MVLVTLVFVFLYAAALTGWLRPLSDVTMIARLEPIIFLVIGYYFGRLPGYHNEQVLREEVERVSKKADSAQRQKEQAQNERETIEEKIRNTRVALRSELLEIDAEKQMVDTRDPRNRPGLSTHARAVETAINILNS